MSIDEYQLLKSKRGNLEVIPLQAEDAESGRPVALAGGRVAVEDGVIEEVPLEGGVDFAIEAVPMTGGDEFVVDGEFSGGGNTFIRGILKR